MKIIRRTSVAPVATAITPAEALSLAQIPAAPVADTLVSAKPKRTNSDDQQTGEILAGKLADYIQKYEQCREFVSAAKKADARATSNLSPKPEVLGSLVDELSKVERAITSLGKKARLIGSGDPDCASMFRSAQDSQKGQGDNASEQWGACFITGWVAKRTATDPNAKPNLYRLVVQLPDEDKPRMATYATSVAAEWAGVRWLCLKTDSPETLVVWIETLDPASCGIKGEDGKATKPQAIPSLSYVLLPDTARAKMATIIRRANLSGQYHEKKMRGALSNRMRVKNYVATFSGG